MNDATDQVQPVALRFVPSCRTVCVGLAVLFAVATPTSLSADDPKEKLVLPDAVRDAVDFERQIAPILENRCVQCHGAEKQKSGFRLDTRDAALKGGNSGEVIQLQNSAESRLILLLLGLDDDEVVMPPQGERLSPREIALLRGWIDQGAKWPKERVLTSKGTSGNQADPRKHWSFQSLNRPVPPAVRNEKWVRNPIDRFILNRLEAEGIAPSPETDKITLLRRVTLDLIGLPPTPDEVTAFVNDSRSDAFEHVVDRLLMSPHYGEKWARTWLDLCHYADTDGYLQDMLRPVAWRYRQWLVEALNRDLPFDQFTIEQLAGDLLSEATTDQRIATGFLRNTLSNREGGADLEEYRVEQIVDRTSLVGTTWLGLTVGCARCHDHKFDPISQKEFYQLFAWFDSGDEINIDAPLTGELERYREARPEYDRKRAELLEPVAAEIAELQALWEKKMLQAVAQPGKEHVWDRQWEVLGLIWGNNLGEGQLEGCQIVFVDPTQRTQVQTDRLLDYFLSNGSVVAPDKFRDLKLSELAGKLQALAKELPNITRAPTVQETQTPRETHIHLRGDFRTKGISVMKGTLSILPPLPENAEPHRLALARWLVSADNPLTPRVTVNRHWQEFFGRGLVLTSEDFGTRGEKPSHPELLDWLAAEFRDGWSIKRLHRLIVTSATYRQSSRPRPELATREPNNVLVARQTALRLSAEQVRDVTLAASGLLSRKLGGPSVFPPQPENVSKEAFDSKWTVSEGEDRYRRGLYTFIQRLAPFAQNVTFDAPATSRICTRRERSNTSLQALTLLNDPVFFEAAQSLAGRLVREATGNPAERIEFAFRVCLGRTATVREKERLETYYHEQFALFRETPKAVEEMFPNRPEGIDPIELAAWTGLSSVLLNLHEFITRD